MELKHVHKPILTHDLHILKHNKNHEGIQCPREGGGGETIWGHVGLFDPYNWILC